MHDEPVIYPTLMTSIFEFYYKYWIVFLNPLGPTLLESSVPGKYRESALLASSVPGNYRESALLAYYVTDICRESALLLVV